MTHSARAEPSSSAARAGNPVPPTCCPLYHEAVELIGRRWTGAIVDVLLQRPTLRFSEIANAVPQLSDRLLSERMKELEARGLVAREVAPGPPVRVSYSLTQMGFALGPALGELKHWARHWLDASASTPGTPPVSGTPSAVAASRPETGAGSEGRAARTRAG
jgi:DNA-binding HxlR family transcriptional regulator